MIAAALLALFPHAAHAHASLLSSTPANGSRVSQSPATIRLLFSEPVVPNLSHVMLDGSDGSMSHLSVVSDPHEVRALLASVPSLADAAYRLTWHIVSADGHPVSGSFTFTVGSAAAAAPPDMSSSAHGEGEMQMSDVEPSVAGAALVPAILRGVALSALLGFCGLLGFAAYANQRTGREMRLATQLCLASVVFFLAHLVVWVIHVSPANELNGDMVASALSTSVGMSELVRLVLAALALWALVLARRPRMAFAFALAAVIAGGAIGHPAAITPAVSIPAKALHLVGVAFWMGGLIWLATSASKTTIMRAATVSRVALISIVIVALTGVVQGILFLPSLADLFQSAYGITMIGKAVGLLVLAAFGAYHRYRLMPSLDMPEKSPVLVRSVRREIAVMIAVVLLGGFLAYVPTPEVHQHTQPSHRTDT